MTSREKTRYIQDLLKKHHAWKMARHGLDKPREEGYSDLENPRCKTCNNFLFIAGSVPILGKEGVMVDRTVYYCKSCGWRGVFY